MPNPITCWRLVRILAKTGRRRLVDCVVIGENYKVTAESLADLRACILGVHHSVDQSGCPLVGRAEPDGVGSGEFAGITRAVSASISALTK